MFPSTEKVPFKWPPRCLFQCGSDASRTNGWIGVDSAAFSCDLPGEFTQQRGRLLLNVTTLWQSVSSKLTWPLYSINYTGQRWLQWDAEVWPPLDRWYMMLMCRSGKRKTQPLTAVIKDSSVFKLFNATAAARRHHVCLCVVHIQMNWLNFDGQRSMRELLSTGYLNVCTWYEDFLFFSWNKK